MRNGSLEQALTAYSLNVRILAVDEGTQRFASSKAGTNPHGGGPLPTMLGGVGWWKACPRCSLMCIATPVKYLMDAPHMVEVLGRSHGQLFFMATCSRPRLQRQLGGTGAPSRFTSPLPSRVGVVVRPQAVKAALDAASISWTLIRRP